jgi:hypothetical protein
VGGGSEREVAPVERERGLPLRELVVGERRPRAGHLREVLHRDGGGGVEQDRLVFVVERVASTGDRGEHLDV